MDELLKRINEDVEKRVLRDNDGNPDFAVYLDHKVMNKGEVLDIVTRQIEFDRPTYAVFVDDEPGKNWGHRCHYRLYNAETGEYLRKVRADFPHFMPKEKTREVEETIELIRKSPMAEPFVRKKKLRIPLEPGKLSAYAKIAPLPLAFWLYGTRYAILFSGGSNGRHVNDLEFLYRTLVDVYGYNTGDIYVLNYDGTLDYSQAVWPSGWTEPPASDGFGPDGSAWRMDADGRIVGRGDRAGFQAVISDLASRIGSRDCLLIHTNNHGWFDGSGGFMSAYGGTYYASDFAADLAALPQFKTLLVFMEQCASGSFALPIMNNSPATRTVFQAAVPGDESSAGGWPFDPWAEMWISAMAGVRGDGSALAISPDDDLNTLISAWEAYDYALSIDNPVMSESSAGLSQNVYLCRCRTKAKPLKEWKEPKEWAEVKELLEPKLVMEPKRALEGPQIQVPFEELREVYIEVDERIERLERAVDKLTPFIDREQRPDVEP